MSQFFSKIVLYVKQMENLMFILNRNLLILFGELGFFILSVESTKGKFEKQSPTHSSAAYFSSYSPSIVFGSQATSGFPF